MVKSIIKSPNLNKSKEKRVRGLKVKVQKNKKKISKKKENSKNKNKSNILKEKSFDLNYYLNQKINFLNQKALVIINNLLNKENSEFFENVLNNEVNYINNKDDRYYILIGLKDVITEICQQNKNLKFRDNFIFSVIALFDYYITKCEKQLKKQDMVKIIYACLGIIDKEQNIGVFTSPFFTKYYTNDIEFEILETVNLNLYPVKLYDFFDIFYFKVIEIKKNDKKFINYFLKFKEIFLDLSFYLLFHEYSKTKKPSINFISCILLTYEKTKIFLPKKENTLLKFINELKTKFKYSDDEYLIVNKIIEESLYKYNKMYSELNRNK